jgi:hypothetical protein
VFDRGDHYLLLLTYGSDVHWVKNVFAAGGASLHTRGRDVALGEPELIDDPEGRLVPAFVRTAGRLIGAAKVLRMRRIPP